MFKFKVGDKVRCIRTNAPTNEGHGGAGWKEGQIYTVRATSEASVPIYWMVEPGIGGVYENWLQLISDKPYERDIHQVVQEEVKRILS